MKTVNINDVDYNFEELSNDAKAQIASIQFVDAELDRLKFQAAALHTARQTYANALQKTLAAEVIESEKISFS